MIMIAKKEHEATYQDLVAFLTRHADEVSGEEMLAIAGNMLGKLIAMQDQRTMTRERALDIVGKNMELGNKQVIDEFASSEGAPS